MEKKVIVILNVVKLDNGGNIDIVLEHHSSLDEARASAERHIDDWLSRHGFTLDEQKASEGNDDLCERGDYGNLTEVRYVDGIAEIDTLIKEFEV